MEKRAGMWAGRLRLLKVRFAATDRRANAELKHRLAATLSAGKGPLGGVLLPRQDGHPVMAYVMPVAEPRGDSPQEDKIIVVLIDSSKQSEPSKETLRQGFGLTPAEIRVAIAFARGRDLHEIANDQRLSIETVRKYFKAVLAKTNTSRQAELATLLTRLAQRPEDPSAVPLPSDQREFRQDRGASQGFGAGSADASGRSVQRNER